MSYEELSIQLSKGDPELEKKKAEKDAMFMKEEEGKVPIKATFPLKDESHRGEIVLDIKAHVATVIEEVLGSCEMAKVTVQTFRKEKILRMPKAESMRPRGARPCPPDPREKPTTRYTWTPGSPPDAPKTMDWMPSGLMPSQMPAQDSRCRLCRRR